ncbi:MAG: metallophosphoesterase family protein [Candidatus Thioglobus sp.]|nr:metallophosphoesterase family protein [Candidatus Thioglobus sp.]
MLKIGILSDTHGTVHPQIVELINDCDIALHAGDIVDIEVLQKLNPKQEVLAVRGNNDYHITHLDDVEVLNLPGGKIVIEHGHRHGHYEPSHESLRKSYPDAKVIIYGHTHRQVIDKTKTPWVINPGAAGGIRNYDGAKCLMLTINSQKEWGIETHIFD